MPTPLLLRRRSGLYVRFLLPADVRELIGSRFIVRSLGAVRGDLARLKAAQLGYALSHVVTALRAGGPSVDAKKLIEAALAAGASGTVRPYEINLRDGTIKADGPADHKRAMEALTALTAKVVIPGLPGLVLPGVTAPTPEPSGPMLHAAIDRFLEQFGEKARATAKNGDRAKSGHSWQG